MAPSTANSSRSTMLLLLLLLTSVDELGHSSDHLVQETGYTPLFAYV